MPVALWMRRLAVAGVLLCFAVVVLGAYVRLTAAGLGCPDWPGCYGHLTPPGAEHSPAAQAAYGERPLGLGKAWREMVHRYAAGALGVVILSLTALAISARRRRPVSLPFALALFATLIVQALLGMLTVTWQLKPLIVTLHLLFGMTTLGLLWWLMLSLPRSSWGATALKSARRAISGGGASPIANARQLALAGLAALGVQMALGGAPARLGAARGARPAAAHRHSHGAQGLPAVAGHGAHRRRGAAAARHAGAAAMPEHPVTRRPAAPRRDLLGCASRGDDIGICTRSAATVAPLPRVDEAQGRRARQLHRHRRDAARQPRGAAAGRAGVGKSRHRARRRLRRHPQSGARPAHR